MYLNMLNTQGKQERQNAKGSELFFPYSSVRTPESTHPTRYARESTHRQKLYQSTINCPAGHDNIRMMSSLIESCSQICVLLAAACHLEKNPTPQNHEHIHAEGNLVLSLDLVVLYKTVPAEHHHDASSSRMRDPHKDGISKEVLELIDMLSNMARYAFLVERVDSTMPRDCVKPIVKHLRDQKTTFSIVFLICLLQIRHSAK